MDAALQYAPARLPKDVSAGWFTNYSNEDYHNGVLKGLVSSSDWKEFARSPAHLWISKTQPRQPTPALIFGSAFHSLCMEFDSEVAVMPQDINRRTKAGKVEYQAFLDESKDKYVVSADDMVHLKAMVDAVNRHRFAKQLIKMQNREITGIFQDVGTDIWCKIRPDYIDFEKCIISDLKTCVDAGREEFTKAIFNYKYNWSAAWYKHGARMLNNEDFTFVIIAVEKTPPYGVNTFIIDGRAIRIGWEIIFGLIGDYADCLQKNKWPCYEQELIWPDIPGWVKWELNN